MAAKRRKSLPRNLSLRRAVLVLHERVARLERAIERRHRPIGFTAEAHGEVLEVEDSETDDVPPETRR